ncbi:endonuclease/exonuclease/phosphatase [Sphingomonas sp. LH128]|uniref:endonuclease/exonuclease/phosphatase family protein n=1 Tax=Sphingomonas sp. LH128 TaxID=473781 RepID=UPI00027CA01A|nr:endonuclease/exonuclease/phosphatase family protein [Sphingomonas sp. LH128]EJU10555.1 endonuclease/exonuclease/phosphatase [Sphingomonas sp. LH128]
MKSLTKMSLATAAAVVVLNLSKPSPAAAPERPFASSVRDDGTLSVMTYNVKGLPFPLAYGRAEALGEIGNRLRKLRREGRQPDVILLQEAFIPEAKAIARRAGYAHVLLGPGVKDAPRDVAQPDTFVQNASWSRGEAVGPQVDSGLVILSDHPIVKASRMVFPEAMCAGFDCLASKGVVIAWIAVPGRAEPVAVADTHLNSRKASGVPVARANVAFTRQVEAMRTFLRRQVDPHADLILGGDFNIGDDAERIAATRELIAGGQDAAETADGPPDQQRDLAAIRERNKDKLYHRGLLRLRSLEVPLGEGTGKDAFSDHLGYVAHYKLS